MLASGFIRRHSKEFGGTKNNNIQIQMIQKNLCFFTFCYQIIQRQKERKLFFLNIMPFEQVRTGQECPLTLACNIPQVNKIIIKERLLIGNQKGVLGLFFFHFHNFSNKFSTFCSGSQHISQKRAHKRGNVGASFKPYGSSRSFLTQLFKKTEPGSVSNLRP